MLNLDIPTHHDVLADAQEWRAKNTRDDLKRAEEVLRQGLKAYPYALELGDELALVLEKLDRDDEAAALVTDLERRLGGAGEETLCRLAKLHKKRAEGHLADRDWPAAEQRLAESERLYGRAFDVDRGFYPRINQLTTRFVRAGVAKAGGRESAARDLLDHTRTDAKAMLDDPTAWEARNPDDEVWVPAARGEANVLLGRWEEAEAAYARAVRAAGGRQFYHTCMSGQLTHLLLPAVARLGEVPRGRLADPAAFFTPPQEAAA